MKGYVESIRQIRRETDCGLRDAKVAFEKFGLEAAIQKIKNGFLTEETKRRKEFDKQILQNKMREFCRGQSVEMLKESANKLSHPNSTIDEDVSWAYVMAELEERMSREEYTTFEASMVALCE